MRRRLVAAAVLAAISAGVPARAQDGAEARCPGVPVAITPGDLPRVAGLVAAARPARILAIGSSTTAGVGAGGQANAYPAAMLATLTDLLPGRPIEMVTAGVWGERAPSAARRLEEYLVGGGIDLVVWQVGTNDSVFGTDSGEFPAVLDRGIAAARKAGADILLIDPQHYGRRGPGERYEAFVAAVAAAGAKWGVPVLGRYAWMKQVASVERARRVDLLAFDGFHMNARGHRCLGIGLAFDLVARVERLAAAQGAPAPTASPAARGARRP